MTTQTPLFSQHTSAPSYSELPEVSAGWLAQNAPEAVVNNMAKGASSFASGTIPPGGWSAQQQPQQLSQQSLSPVGLKPGPEPSTTPVPTADSDGRGGSGPRRATVLILSVLVGTLAAAVVGLAAATGVMAKRASDAESASANANAQLAVDRTCPSVTTTITIATTTATANPASQSDANSPVTLHVADVSNGCGDVGEQISGTTYTTRIFGKVKFTRYCNAEPRQFPIYGMLTHDYESCMDACAAWTSKGSEVIGPNNTNSKCGGIRFVPAWTNKTVAYNNNARGNCFLQASPQKKDDLKLPNLADGVTCHAAIVVKSS